MKKIFTFIILSAAVYGIYFLLDETQIIKKSECLAVGKNPVSSNDIGKQTLNPWIVCAEPTTDAGKECYDSIDCTEACILERNSDGYENAGDFIIKNGSGVRGYCQPYEEMDCFVERNRGMIVVRKCSEEE
ncbi:hypothetical protein K0B04_04145 [Patescibacteria group bacterium]|nr:hypothetical protein [Patescibacteria group bacterium]